MMNQESYNNYLINLAADSTNLTELDNALRLNIYITLIALSNGYYSEEKYQKSMEKIENFLRKTNNLKVKIQLKRKASEIDELIKDIKEIYENNTDIITKLNPDKLDIISTIDSQDTTNITKLIDKLTKEKISCHNDKDMFDNLRNKIINNIFKHDYYIIDDNTLCIKCGDNDIIVSLAMFYKIFDYLLDIDNYPQPLLNNLNNRMHTIMIANIIKLLVDRTCTDKETLIPIILTHNINNKIDPSELDFSNFNIDNIKITDLYSLAENNKNIQNEKSAKWRNITIPNDYLYERINEIGSSGTYYFKDNIFYMEKVNKKVSDFKISISSENMLKFLTSSILVSNKTPNIK